MRLDGRGGQHRGPSQAAFSVDNGPPYAWSLGPRRCPICGRFLRATVRGRRRQHYARAECARQAKRDRDRQYQREARRDPEGRAAKRVQNEATREQLGWTEYMRFWRKAKPELRAAQERARAKRYYRRHRAAILAKRRRTRAAQKAARTACSH